MVSTVTVPAGLLYSHCTRCDKFKISSEFSKYRSDGCITCRNRRSHDKRMSLRGMLSTMLGNAKLSDRKRNANNIAGQ